MIQLSKLALTTVLAGTIWVFPTVQNFGNANAQTSNSDSPTQGASIDLEQVQQLTEQNPQLVQQAQQLLLQNPELVKMLVQQLVQSNPQLLEQLENNPQLVRQIGGQNQQLIQLLRQNPQLVQQLQQIIQDSRNKR